MANPKSLGGMADHEFYCTTAEAARSLGVSIRTVQLWVDGGALAAWKTVGGHRRITLDSLNKLRCSAGIAEAATDVKADG